MGWLIIEDKDWYLLINQLMECVEHITIRRGNKETHTCIGQSSLVAYLSFEEEKGDHFQGSMVGDMERLGKLVRKPCCTSLYKEYME